MVQIGVLLGPRSPQSLCHDHTDLQLSAYVCLNYSSVGTFLNLATIYWALTMLHDLILLTTL